MVQSRIEVFFEQLLEDETEKRIITMIAEDLQKEEMLKILLDDDKGVKK